MVAVRIVRVRSMSVEETADIRVRCPTWVRNWLRRYDEGGLECLRDLPRCGQPRRIPRNVMDGMVANVTGFRITPVERGWCVINLNHACSRWKCTFSDPPNPDAFPDDHQTFTIIRHWVLKMERASLTRSYAKQAIAVSDSLFEVPLALRAYTRAASPSESADRAG